MTKILAMPGEGERLDRFELVAELASGGMATVYLGRLLGMGGFKRFVAIKRLHPHLAKEQDFIQMFLDEARLAARLHHPNVVPILEIGVQTDQYYVVMEYIEGDTVGHLMARAAASNRKLPVPVAIRIMLDALTGLHAAHELADEDGTPLDIVHRDVSPQNILVGIDGVGRITDFGVAKAATRLANATQGGQLKGKLAYMSPEQVRGNVPVDRRADIFAAGIVLWETLTGYRLFKADGEAETLFKVMTADVPSIRAYDPSVPPEVEVVITRALAREPEHRFRTAADFAEALEQAARVYDLVATVRSTAAFVNEIIGLDISQQREIVRAWLARSEVSKSGVARSEAIRQMQTTQPLAPPPAEPQPQLSSLVDDDLEMATRADADPEDFDDATRIQPAFVPQASASGSVLSVGRSNDAAYRSVATARDFQPVGAMAGANPALANTLNAPQGFLPPASSGQLPPQWSGNSGPYPGQMAPPQMVQAPKRTLPLWTLVFPAIIILGGAIALGLRARTPVAPPAPAPTQIKSQAPPPPTQVEAPPPTATMIAQPPQTAEATLDTKPVETATAKPVQTQQPVVDTKPAETKPAETAQFPTPTPTHRPTTPVAPTPTKKPPENREFGGRK